MTVATRARTVLVVDDSAVTRSLLAELCADAGGAVEGCANGFEAVRAAARIDDLALVITDVHMPDLTGLELVRLFREQERFRRVPIFVISTDAAASDSERALSMGATRFFAKPFDVPELTRAVRAAITVGEGGAAGDRGEP